MYQCAQPAQAPSQGGWPYPFFAAFTHTIRIMRDDSIEEVSRDRVSLAPPSNNCAERPASGGEHHKRVGDVTLADASSDPEPVNDAGSLEAGKCASNRTRTFATWTEIGFQCAGRAIGRLGTPAAYPLQCNCFVLSVQKINIHKGHTCYMRQSRE